MTCSGCSTWYLVLEVHARADRLRWHAASESGVPHSLLHRPSWGHLRSLWGTSLQHTCCLLDNNPTLSTHYPPRVVHRPLSGHHFTPKSPLLTSATTHQTICDMRFRRHCKAHPARHLAHHLRPPLTAQLRLQKTPYPLTPTSTHMAYHPRPASCQRPTSRP